MTGGRSDRWDCDNKEQRRLQLRHKVPGASAGSQRLFAFQAIALRYSDPDARDGASAHNRNGAGDESEDDEDDDDDDWSDSSNLEENLPFDSEA